MHGRGPAIHSIRCTVQTLIITPEATQLGLVATHSVIEARVPVSLGAAFDELRRTTCLHLANLYTPEFVAHDPILQGFRELRKAVGRSSRKYPCSIEGLISYLHRRGELPTIHPIVDIYNLVSLETRLTLGAHDLDQVDGDITLRLVACNETFIPLGATASESVPAGEYAYVDDAGDILCRMDYKQCDKTKLTAETVRCLVILQGNANTAIAVLGRAKAKLDKLMAEFI